jgi:hypothetical protein
MIAVAAEQQIEPRRQPWFGARKHSQQQAVATDDRKSNDGRSVIVACR